MADVEAGEGGLRVTRPCSDCPLSTQYSNNQACLCTLFTPSSPSTSPDAVNYESTPHESLSLSLASSTDALSYKRTNLIRTEVKGLKAHRKEDGHSTSTVALLEHALVHFVAGLLDVIVAELGEEGIKGSLILLGDLYTCEYL